MLSVAVQKDPMEYKNKIIGSLTLRNLGCAALAIGVSMAVASYCYFLLNMPIDFAMYIIIIISFPIWALGFWHPYGMNLEEFAPLWFKFNFSNNVVVYESSDFLCKHKKYGAKAETEKKLEQLGYRVNKDYKMLCKRPDFEAYDIDAGCKEYPSFDK